MKRKSYTENLETILERLETQEEIRDLLKEQNGATRENTVALAVVCQWVEDHEAVHVTQSDRIDRVDRKTNLAGVVSAAFAGLGALLFGLKR